MMPLIEPSHNPVCCPVDQMEANLVIERYPWEYSSPRELGGKHFEFSARLRNLEARVTTDEHGRAYPDAAAQAEWFRTQIRAIEAEFVRRRSAR